MNVHCQHCITTGGSRQWSTSWHLHGYPFPVGNWDAGLGTTMSVSLLPRSLHMRTARTDNLRVKGHVYGRQRCDIFWLIFQAILDTFSILISVLFFHFVFMSQCALYSLFSILCLYCPLSLSLHFLSPYSCILFIGDMFVLYLEK